MEKINIFTYRNKMQKIIKYIKKKNYNIFLKTYLCFYITVVNFKNLGFHKHF